MGKKIMTQDGTSINGGLTKAQQRVVYENMVAVNQRAVDQFEANTARMRAELMAKNVLTAIRHCPDTDRIIEVVNNTPPAVIVDRIPVLIDAAHEMRDRQNRASNAQHIAEMQPVIDAIKARSYEAFQDASQIAAPVAGRREAALEPA